MLKPQLPDNEEQRLKELRDYGIMDTEPESSFSDIVAIAAQICNVPIALISLVDENRQWFKASKGLDVPQTSRDVAFCAHAIHRPNEVMEVKDATNDDRFADNPLVTGAPDIRYYAGAPLVTSSGVALGTLCVIDNQARELSADQKSALRALANQVMAQMELRRRNEELAKRQLLLEAKSEELSRFAHLISHDLKSPLRAMSSLSEIIMEETAGKLNEEAEKSLVMLQAKAQHAYKLVDGILQHTLSGEQANDPALIDLTDFIDKVIAFCSPPADIHVIADIQTQYVYLDATLLHQIVQNLVSNAIKYNDKEEGLVKIVALEAGNDLLLEISDNGPGIRNEFHDKIFGVLFTLNMQDRFGQKGTGIGLSTVKRLSEIMNASIRLESQEGEGTVFTLRFPDAIKRP
jgi:signal transduction histidine kinase